MKEVATNFKSTNFTRVKQWTKVGKHTDDVRIIWIPLQLETIKRTSSITHFLTWKVLPEYITFTIFLLTVFFYTISANTGGAIGGGKQKGGASKARGGGGTETITKTKVR